MRRRPHLATATRLVVPDDRAAVLDCTGVSDACRCRPPHPGRFRPAGPKPLPRSPCLPAGQRPAAGGFRISTRNGLCDGLRAVLADLRSSIFSVSALISSPISVTNPFRSSGSSGRGSRLSNMPKLYPTNRSKETIKLCNGVFYWLIRSAGGAMSFEAYASRCLPGAWTSERG